MKQLDIFDLEHNDIEKMEDGSNLISKPMEVVMHESMMPYAEHVILDRALPRVEDGLKPVPPARRQFHLRRNGTYGAAVQYERAFDYRSGKLR